LVHDPARIELSLYCAPVINSGESVWDPPLPRKPGALLAVIALVLIVAGAGFGLYELNSALATRYTPKADGCMSTDLGSLSTLVNDAKPSIAPDELAKSQCRIQFARGDGTPTVVGLVTLDYTGSRLASRLTFTSHEDGDEDDGTQWSVIDGLGEEAWQSTTPHDCSFKVAVRDVNAILVIDLAGVPDEELCTVPGADVQKALSAAAKGTLAKL
jgi:hypothetical protein